MKKINILTPLLLSSVMAFAQAPDIKWAKLYGGDMGENAKSIQLTPDGGFIVAGNTMSSAGSGDVSERIGRKESDYWVLKLDSLGKLEWEKVYGGTEGNEAESIHPTKDGGYIVTGTSRSSDGDVMSHIGHMDYWVVKLDNTGKIQWEKSFGGLDQDESYDVKQTADEGYIVVGTYNTYGTTLGYNSNDIYVVKLDKDGEKEWDKFLGGTGHDVAYSVIQTFDGGYLIGGLSNSTDNDVSKSIGDGDYWVVKLDDKGTIEWEKSLGGKRMDNLNAVVQAKDSAYVLAGWTRSLDGDVEGKKANNTDDIWVVKLDKEGKEIVWKHVYGGSDGMSVANDIVATNDGGFALTGFTYSNNEDFTGNHGGHDAFLLKLDADGKKEWSKLVGGTQYDEANGITATPDGGYAITGFSESRDGDMPTNDFDGRRIMVVRFNGPAMDSVVVNTIADVAAEIATVAGTLPLGAAVYPLILSQDVTWSIVAETGDASIDANGVVTAVADGIVWGKAVSVFNPDFADSVKITITNQSENNSISNLVLNNNTIAIYPNPTEGIVYVKSAVAHSELTLTLLNIEGKVLSQQTIAPNALKGQAIQLDLNKLTSGVYLISIDGASGHHSKVVIRN